MDLPTVYDLYNSKHPNGDDWIWIVRYHDSSQRALKWARITAAAIVSKHISDAIDHG